jgi:signal peptide peptidase SppA
MNNYIPIPRSNRKCAQQHIGPWAIEPKWWAAAVDMVRSGTWKPKADIEDDQEESSAPIYEVYNGVAVIAIDGQMTKRGSSFGGCSTVQVRSLLRQAAADGEVRSIVLQISSPGGTVAGTADLADDVLSVRRGKFGIAKSVTAYIQDMGCSAAYWVASQCDAIYANTTAIIGSIGTYTVLTDETAASEQLGYKFYVVSTGPYKGLGADGKVTEELKADVQREVDELNQPFLSAVASGRGKKIDISAVSDGRAWVSEQAKSLGLIDAIASLDAAIEATSTRSSTMTPAEQVRQIAAEHPESVASFREEGKKAGLAEGRKEIMDLLRSNTEAAKGNHELANKATLFGHDPEAVKLAVDAKAEAEASHKAELEAKQKEIDRLKFESGGQKPVATGKVEEKPETAGIKDPTARARAEWAANHENCQDSFVSEAAYCAFRKLDLDGRVTVSTRK